jgi:hypothetical protein
MAIRTMVVSLGKQRGPNVGWVRNKCEAMAAWLWNCCRRIAVWVWGLVCAMAGSSWLAIPICAILASALVCPLYLVQNDSGRGEAFAWFDGTSAWPSIAIFLFAVLLSIHFIAKIQVGLKQNADELTEDFGLQGKRPDQVPFFGWQAPPLAPEIAYSAPHFPEWETNPEKRINIVDLWQRYLCRGRFWRRLTRAAPMTTLYFLALCSLLPLFGHFPFPPIRGDSSFFYILLTVTLCLFLLLTFVVLDAILLHEGFLAQFAKGESYWPTGTFEKFDYRINVGRPPNERDLADYWDILLIARRTEAVGNIAYYPFVILSLLIVARLTLFDDWTWTRPLVIAIGLHFSLAFYAAWRLPSMAKEYRDKVLQRLKQRQRKAFLQAERIPDATDTMIKEVQSTHQGAFSYLWEQPAIRALLFPSGGIGLATLLQYLQH